MEDKIRILIVEDEALIAENLKLTLQDLGYEVVDTCYNFAEAAAALPTTDADLVLLDINLSSAHSDQTGLALAALVPPDRGFIFLTAYSELGVIREATRLRPAGYLIKPVNPATLFATIQTAIEAMTRPTAPTEPLGTTLTAQPDFFFVKVGTRRVRLDWADVYAIEAGRNYVTLRCKGLSTGHAIRGSLAFVTDQLLPTRFQEDFVRLSRSTAVNRRFITSYDATGVSCGGERFEGTRLSAKRLE